MKAANISAGILLYRLVHEEPEFLLVHPGGPFWAKKDEGVWSIPKGEPDAGEELLAAAAREFQEETGHEASGPFTELTPVRQKSGKKVFAWAAKGDLDPAAIVCNFFEMEWPPRSGKKAKFPEVDRAGWFRTEAALKKINPAQAALIKECIILLSS